MSLSLSYFFFALIHMNSIKSKEKYAMTIEHNTLDF